MLFQPLARTTAMETVSPAFLTASTSMMNSTRISSPIPSEKAQASSKLSLIKVYINIMSMRNTNVGVICIQTHLYLTILYNYIDNCLGFSDHP